MTTIVLILILIAMTALYVAAEFASVAARTFRIEAMARGGNAVAAKLEPHLSDPQALDRYVAACQIGITLASLLLGAIGQARLAEMLVPHLGLGQVAAESVAATLVLLILTAGQVVLGELVPKAVALRFPESVALALYYPMQFSLWIFGWFIHVLNGTGNWFLRRLGVAAHGHRHVHSPEELEQIVARGSSLERDQAERLRRVFRFGDRVVRDAMVPRTSMVALPVTADWDQLLAVVAKHGYTRYPIYEGNLDTLLGFVHVKDLVDQDRSRPLALEPHLRPLTIVPAPTTLATALRRLQRENVQLALIPDEYGGTLGLLSTEDLMEEVVGEIHDEFDRAREPLEVLGSAHWLVRGEVLLADLAPELGLKVEELPEVQTVGGLLMHELGRRPALGDEIERDGLRFKVAELRGARIVRAEVRG